MLNDPKIIITKSLRRLELFDGGKLVKTHIVVLGTDPHGSKAVEGDDRTPEGTFYIFAKNPESKFHLSLGISYPDDCAAARGLEAGLIARDEHDAIVHAIRDGKKPPQKTAVGGEIYIHGGGINGDWTEGCVALENAEIEELFAAVPIGCPVTIVA
ncbi:MAG: L,D-transpeptidase [Acidobacteriota bacterium]